MQKDLHANVEKKLYQIAYRRYNAPFIRRKLLRSGSFSHSFQYSYLPGFPCFASDDSYNGTRNAYKFVNQVVIAEVQYTYTYMLFSSGPSELQFSVADYFKYLSYLLFISQQPGKRLDCSVCFYYVYIELELSIFIDK